MAEEVKQTVTRLADIGEFGLIDRLTSLLPPISRSDIIGAGDDCAVLPFDFLTGQGSDGFLLVTTDALVEGRHFELAYSSFFDIGWKSLAVNLSDIAAMGGTARGVVAALQLPERVSAENVEELYRGLNSLASQHQVLVLGGNITAASELSLALTVIGTAARPPLKRSSAAVNDDLWLSGEIGGAGAGLALLRGALSPDAFPDGGAAAVRRHRQPMPRLSLGQELLLSGAVQAMIDVSDGLLQDAGHIAAQSKVELELSLSAIPFQAGILAAGISRLAAAGFGDDYELLFTAPPAARRTLEELTLKAGSGQLPRLTRIGCVRPQKEGRGEVMLITESGDVKPCSEVLHGADQPGFDHFRGPR